MGEAFSRDMLDFHRQVDSFITKFQYKFGHPWRCVVRSEGSFIGWRVKDPKALLGSRQDGYGIFADRKLTAIFKNVRL
jgi:hypothetical protein